MKKRWLILIVILVIVAIVLAIVFINLFRDKDTTALAKEVNKVTESGYLDENNKANQDVDKYLQSMLKLSDNLEADYLATLLKTDNLSAENEKMANYANAYAAFEVIGQFYNRQIVFSKYTKVYAQQKKQISKNFSKAQKAVDALETYFVEQNVKIGNADEWLARTWDDCKVQLQQLFAFTSSAFAGLNEVYKNCVPSKLVNNAMSDIILDEVNGMTKNIADGQADFGKKLLTFANAYLSVAGEQVILQHSYNAAVQAAAKDIKEKGAESEYYASFVAGELAF